MKRPILTLSVLILFFLPTQAQKLKYKDIFPLLDAKNYDEGVPKLNRFLNDSKNAEHANSHLQKGLYYEYLIEGYNLIADSSLLLNHIDSSVIFLSRAKALITEKELKKKDEYYQAFYRRDLRSGEFGIKVSDVHLDIEKKMQKLRKLKKNASIIYQSLIIANNDYTTSNEEFRHLATTAASEEEFMLLATDEQIASLDDFIKRGDNVKKAFEDIRQAVSVIRVKGYSPELEIIPINDFLVDGKTNTNIYENDVKVWDYGTWAEGTKRRIRRDILRMRDQLKSVYLDLNAQNEKVKSGSGITYDELSPSLDENLVKTLREFDGNPLPEKLLNILIEDTKYRYLTNTSLNTELANENNVTYQLSITDSLNSLVNDIIQQVTFLTEPAITDATRKYFNFLKENYGGDFGLLKYKERVQKKYEKAQEKWSEKYKYWYEKSKWGVSPDAMDSIYLIAKSDSLYESIPLSKYYTIAVDSDDSSYVYAIGIEFTGDKDTGFLTKIGTDRVIQWKENFDLGKFEYSDSAILVIGKFIPTEEGSISSYIFSYVPDTPSNLIVVNANKSGGINWNNELTINRPPITTKFNSDVKETYIYYISEEELNTYEGEDSGYIVIDRRGKTR